MTDQQSPFQSLFEAQQALLETGQEVVETTVRAPLEMNDAVRDSLEGQRELHRQSLELTRGALDDVLDTVEATSPTDDVTAVRETVDESFDTLLARQEEVFDEVDEGYEEALDGLERALDELLEQVQALVELNEELEAQATDAAGAVGPGLGLADAVTDQFEGLDEAVTETDEPDAAEVDRQRQQIEAVRERIENLQTELESTVEGADDGDGQPDESETDSQDGSDREA